MPYAELGRLIQAGNTAFSYDAYGALTERRNQQGVTRFFYGADTMLDRVVLPSKTEIRYEYDQSNPVGPARRFRNGNLTTEYIWLDLLRLSVYRDHDHQLEYTFLYDAAGALDRLRIAPLPPDKVQRPGPRTDWAAYSADWVGAMSAYNRRERLHSIFGPNGRALDFRCGTDQVGTLKMLTDASGHLVKAIERDSFGRPFYDSQPDLFLPIGFAGGLEDPDTGLTRFGWRDYDPTVGRFTALDPANDRRGDGDLYDYCVDDPVGRVDPTGLFVPLLMFLGGKALALGIAAVGSYGAAWITDKLRSKRDGKESSAAVDGMNKVAPVAALSSAASALPGVVAISGGAAVPVAQRVVSAMPSAQRIVSAMPSAQRIVSAIPSAQRIGAAVMASKHGDKIIRVANHAAKFVEGFVVPGPADVTSAAASAGGLASAIIGEVKKRKK